MTVWMYRGFHVQICLGGVQLRLNVFFIIGVIRCEGLVVVFNVWRCARSGVVDECDIWGVIRPVLSREMEAEQSICIRSRKLIEVESGSITRSSYRPFLKCREIPRLAGCAFLPLGKTGVL